MAKTRDSNGKGSPHEGLTVEFLISLINELPEGIFFKDLDSRFILANRAVAEHMGAEKPEDLIGTTDHDFYPKEMADAFLADERTVRETGRKLIDNEEPKVIRGIRRSLIVTKVPVFGDGGKMLGLVGISRDITEFKRTEEALRNERNLLRSLIEILPLSMYTKDTAGRKTMANPFNVRVMGHSSEAEVLGKTDFQLFPKEVAERFFADDRSVLDTGTPILHREEHYFSPEGQERWLLTSKVPLRDSKGAIVGLVGVGLDITDRKRGDAELAFQRTLLKALMDNVPDQIFFKDTESRFLQVSKAQAERFGLKDPSEAIGKTDFDFFTEIHARQARADELRILMTGKPELNKEEVETRQEGPDRWVLTDKMPLFDDHGKVIGTFGVSRDITEIRQADEKLKFMATHDPLTNLPNRFLLNDRLRMSIGLSQRNQMPLAVMLIDLDNFKTVNDTLGHDVGDGLLCSFAERIQKCLRVTDTLARMGGDEFVAILSEIKSPDDPTIVATRILSALEEPHHVGAHDLFVSSSIGISVYPDDCDDAETLLRNADIAMYTIKSTSKNGFRYYSQQRLEGSGGAVVSEQDLVKALTENQFELYYQPIRDVDSQGITLAEVLLRWHHPEKGLLDAGSFVPIAEKTGFIIPMSEWVLRRACEQKRTWAAAGLPTVSLAVNISPKHFQIDGFVSLTERILIDTGVKPSELFFEITETSAIKNIEKSRTTLLQLAALGVRIIIDDFGTGYSSLRWLKAMPTYAIKIDRFFVQHIQGDPNNIAVLGAIISMAHGLGLKVIAGGVETEEQANTLRSLGRREVPSLRCDSLQGYFVGRPAPASQLEETIRKSR